MVGSDPLHNIPFDTPGATICGTGSELTITVKGSDVIEQAPLVTITLTFWPFVSDLTNVLEALAAPSETSFTKNSYVAPGTAAAVMVNASPAHNSAGSGVLVKVAVKDGTTLTVWMFDTKVGEVPPEHSTEFMLARASLLYSVVEVNWLLRGLKVSAFPPEIFDHVIVPCALCCHLYTIDPPIKSWVGVDKLVISTGSPKLHIVWGPAAIVLFPEILFTLTGALKSLKQPVPSAFSKTLTTTKSLSEKEFIVNVPSLFGPWTVVPLSLNSYPFPLDPVASKAIPSPIHSVLFVTVFEVDVFVIVTVNVGADPDPTVIIISFDGVAVQLFELRVLIVSLLKWWVPSASGGGS